MPRVLRGVVLAGAVPVCAALSAAAAPFDSENVALRAWLDLGVFGASSGNDCWGYVSPAGREYALMGLSNQVAFVEITDPQNPVIVGSVSHPNCVWCDVKVYDHYAYIVTECGSGIQVVDLGAIDQGQVRLVRTISSPPSSHNVAIDTVSAYLYTAISSVIFDLSDPANPQRVGSYPFTEHDVQVVTYTQGPYAGRQIMFGAGEDRGVDIIDVTDKANPVLLSRTRYPDLSYCHQVWTEDLHYLYINDELDGINRTTVMEITDLQNPVVAGDYTSGLAATDHNNYVNRGIIYEADYHSGLRIFDLRSDPVHPEQVAWFDTYPPDDDGGYDGAWSVFPYFPSGTVIVSDINRGLFVLEPVLERLIFGFPFGLPEQLQPDVPTPVTIAIREDGATLDPSSVTLHVSRNGGGFIGQPMVDNGDGTFSGFIPAGECFDVFEFYFSAKDTGGRLFTSPPGAPAESYQATVYTALVAALDEPLEADPGWSTAGAWAFGQPTGGGGEFGYPDPTSGHTGSNVYGYNLFGDYENNLPQRHLTSGAIDCSGLTGVRLSFWRWLGVEQPAYDHAYLRVSNDGTNWVTIWQNGSQVTDNSWVYQEFDVSAIADDRPSVYLRWTMGPTDGGWRYCGWNIDDIRLAALVCEPSCAGDLDGDGDTDQSDLGVLLGDWGCSGGGCAGDLDGDGDTDLSDLGILLADWGCVPS